jgi:hypothetical protein
MTARTFTDSKNRVWVVAVTLNAITNVSAKVGLDLRLLVEDHDHVAAELDDPARLQSVLAVVLADQLDRQQLTIEDLFATIETEAQMTAMVMALYQATFDFFQNQGQVLNDALARVQRAHLTAQKNASQRMNQAIQNGHLDRYLELATNPDQALQYLHAAQDAATNPQLAAAWQTVLDSNLPQEKRVPDFLRMVVQQNLQLTTPPPTPTPTTTPKPVSPEATAAANAAAALLQTTTERSGNAQASQESTPESSPGVN